MEDLKLQISQADRGISTAYREGEDLYNRALREHAYEKSRWGYQTTKLAAHVGPGVIGGVGASKAGAIVGGVFGGPPGAAIGFQAGWLFGGLAGLYVGNQYLFHPGLECWARDPQLDDQREQDILSRFEGEAKNFFNSLYQGIDGIGYLGRDILGRLQISGQDEKNIEAIKKEIVNLFEDASGTVSLEFRTAPVRRLSSEFYEIRLDRSELDQLAKVGEHWVCPTTSELFDKDSLMADFMGEAVKHYCYAYFAHIQLEISKNIKKSPHLFETVKGFRDNHLQLFNDHKKKEKAYRSQKFIDHEFKDNRLIEESLRRTILNYLPVPWKYHQSDVKAQPLAEPSCSLWGKAISVMKEFFCHDSAMQFNLCHIQIEKNKNPLKDGMHPVV